MSDHTGRMTREELMEMATATPVPVEPHIHPGIDCRLDDLTARLDSMEKAIARLDPGGPMPEPEPDVYDQILATGYFGRSDADEIGRVADMIAGTTEGFTVVARSDRTSASCVGSPIVWVCSYSDSIFIPAGMKTPEDAANLLLRLILDRQGKGERP